MLVKLLIFCSAVVVIRSADHETFKDCSRVEFCTALRTRNPSDDYSVDPNSVTNDDANVLSLTLVSTSGDLLSLILTGLQRDTFRLKIKEVESSRYELTDVLDGEPEGQDFGSVDSNYESATLTNENNSVTIKFSPFSIEFIKNDVTEVVFDGSRLSLSKNDVNAPFSFGVTFPESVQMYGLHEHCDTVALGNTAPGGVDPYRLKNSDVAGFEINSTMALYGAVPVIYGHSPSCTAGIFLHNAAEQWIETSNDVGSAYFMVETGTLDLFVFLGPEPKDVVRYHQSRYGYETQEEVKSVASSLDDGNFQVDAIWLDIDYTDGYKYFTWNPETFSDPDELQATIASTNKKLVTIIDPHIKVEPGYGVYDGALQNDLFVRNADGSVFEGQCWPGVSSYMDFLNPAAREYYGSMYSYENFPKTTPTIGGIWNDMNEPSVFDNSLEMTLPPDSLHIGGVRHREIHNIYGFLHTMATHQGLIARDNGELRPFVLTRSHFAGSQRYTAFWSGDNTADWPYLQAAFQECLASNILGIVFCGADVGGFFGNPTNSLMERWYLAGAWLPFYRAHSDKYTDRREPYLWPEDTQAILRDAIQTRYKHLPVWYTLFYEHTRTGDPLIRPLFYQYPEETDGYNIDYQLLLGGDILVRAVTNPDETNVSVYFPGGDSEKWVSMNTDDVQTGGGWVDVPVTRETIPVYYRSGAVIVRKDTIRSNTAGMTDDPHTLYYTPNEEGVAHGTIYLDDGQSFKYRDSSDYNYLSIDVAGDSVTWSTIDGNGDYEFVVEKVIRRDIIERPDGSRTYKENVFTTDASGVPFKNLKFGGQKNGVLKLK